MLLGNVGYIYIRGEFFREARMLNYPRVDLGHLGNNLYGTQHS